MNGSVCASNYLDLCLFTVPPTLFPYHFFLTNLFYFCKFKCFPFFTCFDFNVDFLLNVNHPLLYKLCNLLDSFSFVQLVSQPTRVTSNGSSTLIDLVLSSSLDHVQDCNVIPPLDTSDHRGIQAHYIHHTSFAQKKRYCQC